MKKVRTRFAPSPTGELHIGGVRTALFSWAYAKHHDGDFLLRIEDTDKERSTDAFAKGIVDGLSWLGLTSDEPLCYQSQRSENYTALIQTLVDTGHAYHCYCSRERLDNLREAQMAAKEKPRYDGHCRDNNTPQDANAPFVIRFKNPQTGHVTFDDQVYGEITFQNTELDDLIIARTDGTPTYNLCVVADDKDMGITHVIRGEDHINNTPRQINILKALGADIPVYAHLPMLLGQDGKKLSKRHGAVNVLAFKEDGILPEALLNYIVRLGWSCGDCEIFSREEIVEKFDLKAVQKAAAAFNYEKLYWLNQHYQKTLPAEKVIPQLRELMQNAGLDINKGPSLDKLLSAQSERCKTLKEIAEKSNFFYQDISLDNLDEALKAKHFTDLQKPGFEALIQAFEKVDNWTQETLHTILNETLQSCNLPLGKIGPSIRLSLTGSLNSPALDVTMELFGKETTLQRLKNMMHVVYS